MFFWTFFAFSVIQQMLAVWSLVSLRFLNPACTSGSLQIGRLLEPTENFEHYFASMWNDCSCAVVWPFFGTALLLIGMKTNLFQSCGHCWVFQICWHIECSTWTPSSVCCSPLCLCIDQLRKTFLSLLAVLWNPAFRWMYLSFSPLPLTSLLISAICKTSSDNHFTFLYFFFLGMI